MFIKSFAGFGYTDMSNSCASGIVMQSITTNWAVSLLEQPVVVSVKE